MPPRLKDVLLFAMSLIIVLSCAKRATVTTLYTKYMELEKNAASNTVVLLAKSYTGGYMGYSVSENLKVTDIGYCLELRKEQRNILLKLAPLVEEPHQLISDETADTISISSTHIDSLAIITERNIEDLNRLLSWFQTTQND